jgi:long-chain acyl-CoA synthetase
VQSGTHDDGTDKPRALSADEEAWIAEPARAALVAVIAKRCAPVAIRPDANLELDLALDSLERVELLTDLEHRTGAHVPPDARATIFSVRQLVDAVLASAATPSGTSVTATDELLWDGMLAGSPADAALTRGLTQRKMIRICGFFLVLRAARLAARLVPGFRAEGTPHLPRDGAFIICPNHQSYLDAFFLAAALPFHTLRRLFFVGASEYFQTAGMRWLARSANILPVDPDANLVSAMQAGAAGLRLNKVLVLFPEGERSIDGDVKKFRKGAAILSSHVGVPIVPVAMDGLYSLWPRSRPFQWRALIPGRSHAVRVRFAAPITVAPGAYAEGTATVHGTVEGLVRELRTSNAES